MAKGKKTGGRKKGTPNKVTAQLKECILEAATLAGGGDLTEYLRNQAIKNPAPFLTLLGKVIPLQLAGDKDNPLNVVQRIERVVVDPKTGDA